MPVTDLRQAHAAAREIAQAALGRDPGPMTAVASSSHHVYVSPGAVVKFIDAGARSRLDREIATARLLAGEAVQRLGTLHGWRPAGQAEATLREPLDHGGFVSQAALRAEIGRLAAVDRDGTVPGRLLDGLLAIAERAPLPAPAAVPVHADCHWGNWLASGPRVTALLDFEWARYGEPADDWVFLARFSGPHLETVLDVIARAAATPPETLRAQCEVRDAAYLASDLRAALERPGAPAGMAADRLHGLEELITGHYWWPGDRR